MYTKNTLSHELKIQHSLLYFIHNSNDDFCALQSEMKSKQYCYKKAMNEMNTDNTCDELMYPA